MNNENTTNDNFDDWIDASQSTDRTFDKTDGEILVGTFKLRQEHIGPNDSNMYHIKTEDEIVGLWGSAIIDRQFERIPLDSRVRVEYLGQAQSKNGRTFSNYKILFKAPEGEPHFAEKTTRQEDEIIESFNEDAPMTLDDLNDLPL